MRNLLTLTLVLAVAGSAGAASITVANLGSPDFGAPNVFPGLTRWQFTTAKESGEDQHNAVQIDVAATSALLHQVFGESEFLSQYTYTDSANLGDVNPTLQAQLDTHLSTADFELSSVPADEDIEGVTEGVAGPDFAGPYGPAEALANSINATTGYGTFFEFAGAVPPAAVADSYDVFHMVLPSDLIQVSEAQAQVTVAIKVAGPGIEQTETFYYGIPEPATMSLLVVGGLALLRRRR